MVSIIIWNSMLSLGCCAFPLYFTIYPYTYYHRDRHHMLPRAFLHSRILHCSARWYCTNGWVCECIRPKWWSSDGHGWNDAGECWNKAKTEANCKWSYHIVLKSLLKCTCVVVARWWWNVVSKLCIRGMESRIDLGPVRWTLDMARRAASRRSIHFAFGTTVQSHRPSRSIVALVHVHRHRKGGIA